MVAPHPVALALVLLALPAGAAEQDALGRRVHLSAPPTRIVSMAPEVTETLFALGLGQRVVGVSQYCNYPPAAARLPKVGGFVNPSLERILALRPDLVVGSRGNPRQIWHDLEQARVPSFAIDPATLPQVLTAIAQLGRLTGREPAAAALLATLRARLDRVDRAVARLRARPRVLLVYSLNPLWVAGSRTFPDDILRRAGGANAGAGLRGYGQYSMEKLIAASPDAILAIPMVGQTPAQAVARLRAAPGFSSLPCVRAGRVFSLDPDLVNRAGPRIADAVETVQRLLAPVASKINPR